MKQDFKNFVQTFLGAKQDFCSNILGKKQDFYSTIMDVKQDFCSNICGAKQGFRLNISSTVKYKIAMPCLGSNDQGALGKHQISRSGHASLCK